MKLLHLFVKLTEAVFPFQDKGFALAFGEACGAFFQHFDGHGEVRVGGEAAALGRGLGIGGGDIRRDLGQSLGQRHGLARAAAGGGFQFKWLARWHGRLYHLWQSRG